MEIRERQSGTRWRMGLGLLIQVGGLAILLGHIV